MKNLRNLYFIIIMQFMVIAILILMVTVREIPKAEVVKVEEPEETEFDYSEYYEPVNPNIYAEVMTFREDGGLIGLFKQCNSEKKSLIKACNFMNDTVRNLSVDIVKENPGELNLGQVCDIFDFYYAMWVYVNDPHLNYLATASESIENGYKGDCDDFSILMASSLLAIGGDVRINYVWNEIEGHAFTEINLGNLDDGLIEEYLSNRYEIDSVFNYETDMYGNKWLNLDWFSPYPGGIYFDIYEGTRYYVLENYCEEI